MNGAAFSQSQICIVDWAITFFWQSHGLTMPAQYRRWCCISLCHSSMSLMSENCFGTWLIYMQSAYYIVADVSCVPFSKDEIIYQLLLAHHLDYAASSIIATWKHIVTSPRQKFIWDHLRYQILSMLIQQLQSISKSLTTTSQVLYYRCPTKIHRFV